VISETSLSVKEGISGSPAGVKPMKFSPARSQPPSDLRLMVMNERQRRTSVTVIPFN